MSTQKTALEHLLVIPTFARLRILLLDPDALRLKNVKRISTANLTGAPRKERKEIGARVTKAADGA